MTEPEILQAIIGLVVSNEDTARLRMSGLTDNELMHVRSALKATHDIVKRELMRRGWDNLTGVSP